MTSSVQTPRAATREEATEPSPEQKRNLARTALYLLRCDTIKFDMRYFCGGPNSSIDYAVRIPPLSAYTSPSESFCFAAHGPPALNNHTEGEQWVDYLIRTFNVWGMTRNALFGGSRASDKLEVCTRAMLFLRGGYTAILTPTMQVSPIESMSYDYLCDALMELSKAELPTE